MGGVRKGKATMKHRHVRGGGTSAARTRAPPQNTNQPAKRGPESPPTAAVAAWKAGPAGRVVGR